MKNLRKKFNRFCLEHRDAGIRNLVPGILIANVVFYIVNLMDPSFLLYQLLAFNRSAILHGQVWRLFTFIILDFAGYANPLTPLLLFLCYFSISRSLEQFWGTFRINLYYLTGYLFFLIAGFLFDYSVNIGTLNMTLFLAFATLFPDETFLLFYIIPVKARWLGILDLVIYLYWILQINAFPYNLIPLLILANYFLYFGKDFFNIFPVSWQINAGKLKRKASDSKPAKIIPISSARSNRSNSGPYLHKCTVCGRNDADFPDLEFRYCSKCSGYHCYCIDHINNHSHISQP